MLVINLENMVLTLPLDHLCSNYCTARVVVGFLFEKDQTLVPENYCLWPKPAYLQVL